LHQTILFAGKLPVAKVIIKYVSHMVYMLKESLGRLKEQCTELAAFITCEDMKPI
jgi:hypothetical protein